MYILSEASALDGLAVRSDPSLSLAGFHIRTSLGAIHPVSVARHNTSNTPDAMHCRKSLPKESKSRYHRRDRFEFAPGHRRILFHVFIWNIFGKLNSPSFGYRFGSGIVRAIAYSIYDANRFFPALDKSPFIFSLPSKRHD